MKGVMHLLIVLLPSVLLGQTTVFDDLLASSAYCLYEQTQTARVSSRIDWLSVARCSDAATIASSGWRVSRYNRNGMNFATAALLMDSVRLQPPSPSDGFHQICNRAWYIWRSPANGQLIAHHSSPGAGFALASATPQCCEDAASVARPGSVVGGDCRVVPVMSVQGAAAAILGGGWVSTGAPFSIATVPPMRFGAAPPVVPPVTGGARGTGTAATAANPPLPPGEAYCVYENSNSHSAMGHIASRTDWVSVAKCGSNLGLGRFQSSFNQANMTFAMAAALADAMRVNFGQPPSSTDAFHKQCDAYHFVARKSDTEVYVHHDNGQAPAPFFQRASNYMCCEDAAAIAFPGAPREDCRFSQLLSVSGAKVGFFGGRWVALGGAVRIPSNPPIDLPGLGQASPNCGISLLGVQSECVGPSGLPVRPR